MKKVIFVCGENAGRSQMAETFFNKYAEEQNLDWIAESAGTYPAAQLNPKVIEAMKAVDLDITDNPPTLFDQAKAHEYERIISFGCIVKTFFSQDIQKKIEEWHIDDPRDKKLEEVVKIRETVKENVLRLINSLAL